MSRRPRHPSIPFAGLVALAVAVATAGAAPVDFNAEIRPLLSDRCYRCHGPDAGSRKGKLRLDQREAALGPLPNGDTPIVPHRPEKSEVVARIFSTDVDEQMPPADSNLTLTVPEKELLKRWISEGAEYQAHWAFLPVAKNASPPPRAAGENPTWGSNFIDAFVAAKLAAEKLAPAPEAAREIFLRRVALNLTGLPPTLAELDAFAADTAPGAHERAVGKFLASSAYGERMALDWLDLARYGDTYGYQADVERDMFPWRDWVIGAFNRNLRYDDFLRWQLAGDLLPNATREQKLATAFNRLHRQTNEGGSVEEEYRQSYVADRVDTFGTAMLGLTLGCARCHDHKFDPITQRDYYALAAFFDNIDESGLYSHFTKATPTPTLRLWPAEKEKRHAEVRAKITATERRLAEVARAEQPAFAAWLAAGGVVAPPVPLAEFLFETVEKNATPSADGARQLMLVDAPKLVAGHTGRALEFSGDNSATAKDLADFGRTDAFSFSLWLKPAETAERAVVLHHSRSWTDSGSRGYELLLDRGRPTFALIHFWPGNAIAVRAKAPVPVGAWSQLVATYDGSSRAAGLRLYLGGVPLATEVVRDQLTREIRHRAEWGDGEVGKIALTLAGRFRDNGFKGGAIDELKIFARELTAPEVALLRGSAAAAPASAPAATLEYFLARHSEAHRALAAELKALRDEENALGNDVPEIMVMAEMPARRTTHVLKRGAYDTPGDVVAPDTPAALGEFPAAAPRDRLGLAQWLTARDNPLAARVAVNRVWKLHFGRGLVATPEDFGSQGALPTHPALLDALARWFVDSGWDLKALHQLILTSATFRQSSAAPRALVDRDPANALLARGPKARLPAEHVRDGALAASGLLVRTLGGPSVKPYQPAGLWEQSGTGKTYKQDHGEALYRRSLYTFWRRTSPPPSMLTFDAVTREVCTAKRETTVTPLQSLVLLNDPQFVEAARVAAEALLRKFPADEPARIREAFRALTARAPDAAEERILALLFVEQKALYAADEAAAKKLLATGESPWDVALPLADFAATAVVVSAIMNFDEFVVAR
ncbi:MAG: hypothetical protein RLZZ15_3136 [Verrucomicrobiota bacterium]